MQPAVDCPFIQSSSYHSSVIRGVFFARFTGFAAGPLWGTSDHGYSDSSPVVGIPIFEGWLPTFYWSSVISIGRTLPSGMTHSNHFWDDVCKIKQNLPAVIES